MNTGILSQVNLQNNIRTILKEYWIARINYTLKYPLKAKFVHTCFDSRIVKSEKTPIANAMHNEIILSVKKAMENEEIINIDISFFFFDLFSACDAVTLYSEIKNVNLTEDFINLTFKKYWRSIVNLDI